MCVCVCFRPSYLGYFVLIKAALARISHNQRPG